MVAKLSYLCHLLLNSLISVPARILIFFYYFIRLQAQSFVEYFSLKAIADQVRFSRLCLEFPDPDPGCFFDWSLF